MRSLISIDFPAPEMEPENAHVVSAVSVPSSNVAICDAAPPRQHSPIRRYSATPCYVLIQVPNVIDTISKRWRSIKPSILHFPTSFLKQIPTPSRFKFINLYY